MAGYYPDDRPGNRPCIKCGKVFKSVNKLTNRVCGPCNETNSKERNPRPVKNHSNIDSGQ
jgi:predicted  nucleic acid-binding Zn-ribbon protein